MIYGDYYWGGVVLKRVVNVYCEEKSCSKALKNCFSKIEAENGDAEPLFVVFTSDYESHAYYAKMLADKFTSAQIIGCSASHILTKEGVLHVGLSIILIYSGIEVYSGIIDDIKKNPMKSCGYISSILDSFSSYDNLICFEMTSAFLNCEELVMDTFRNVLSPLKIPVFGCTAGTARMEKKTKVSLNGKVYDEACVFVMVKNLNGRIGLFLENMFHPTDISIKATDVDCDTRTVYEFNNKPAGEVLSQIIGVPEEKLIDHLLMNPLGRVVGDNIYLVQPFEMNEDKSITYVSRIYSQTRVVLCEYGDPHIFWKETAGRVKKDFDNISFSFVVNCISRSIFFERTNIIDEFSAMLGENYGSYIGISGYGEQMDFEHLNQTMIVAVFE